MKCKFYYRCQAVAVDWGWEHPSGAINTISRQNMANLANQTLVGKPWLLLWPYLQLTLLLKIQTYLAIDPGILGSWPYIGCLTQTYTWCKLSFSQYTLSSGGDCIWLSTIYDCQQAGVILLNMMKWRAYQSETKRPTAQAQAM